MFIIQLDGIFNLRTLCIMHTANVSYLCECAFMHQKPKHLFLMNNVHQLSNCHGQIIIIDFVLRFDNNYICCWWWWWWFKSFDSYVECPQSVIKSIHFICHVIASLFRAYLSKENKTQNKLSKWCHQSCKNFGLAIDLAKPFWWCDKQTDCEMDAAVI